MSNRITAKQDFFVGQGEAKVFQGWRKDPKTGAFSTMHLEKALPLSFLFDPAARELSARLQIEAERQSPGWFASGEWEKAFENPSPSLIKDCLKSPNPEIRATAAASPLVPETKRVELALRDSSPAVGMAAIAQPSNPPVVLCQAMASPHRSVRMTAAQHHAADENVLARAIVDKCPMVRTKAARHEQATAKVLFRALDDPRLVRDALHHPNADSWHWERAATHHNKRVRNAVAGLNDCPDDLLQLIRAANELEAFKCCVPRGWSKLWYQWTKRTVPNAIDFWKLAKMRGNRVLEKLNILESESLWSPVVATALTDPRPCIRRAAENYRGEIY